MFTAEEAEQLVAYLERKYGGAGTNRLEEEELPLGSNVMGVGAIPDAVLQSLVDRRDLGIHTGIVSCS